MSHYNKLSKGTCTGKDGRYNSCGATDVYIACKSRQQCQICSGFYLASKHNSAPYKKKLKARKKTGELDMFIEIWHERPHLCEMHLSIGVHVGIRDFNVSNFMHVCSKGAYRALRLVKENVLLGCEKCVYQQNSGSIEGDPKFDIFRQRHDEMVREYPLLSKKRILYLKNQDTGQ